MSLGLKRNTWNIHRYKLPEKELKLLIPRLEQSFCSGEWYIHFVSQQEDKMVVVLRGKHFWLPKKRDKSWDVMIAYGESVGVGRKWTENIPTDF